MYESRKTLTPTQMVRKLNKKRKEEKINAENSTLGILEKKEGKLKY